MPLVVRTHKLGGILEHGIVGRYLHARNNGHHATVYAGFLEHFLHAGLYHVGDGALGFGPAEVHGHGGKVEFLAAGLVLKHHVAHLGAVAVADDQVIASLDEMTKLGTGMGYIGELLLEGAFFTGAQERIAAKGHHGKFMVHGLVSS